MENFVNLVISGVLLGTFYMVMAYGLALIYGVMNVINLAHAGTIMLGAYTTFQLTRWFDMDPVVSLVVVIPFFFFIGVFLQKSLVQRVLGLPMVNSLLLLFGVWLIMKFVGYAVWTGDNQSITTSYTLKTFSLGAFLVSYPRIIIFIVSIVVTVALQYFLNRTYVGRAIRCMAQERDAASLAGINTEKIALITFGLGTALAAIGGTLGTLIYSFTPDFGGDYMLKSFVIIVLGGVENILGIAMGALALSLVETFSGYIKPELQEMVGFLMLVIILALRPTRLARFIPGLGGGRR